MDWFTHVMLPLGLGLLGFVEPCAIGGHAAFLTTLSERSLRVRAAALALFTLTRTLAFGVIGAVVSVIGLLFVTGQKLFWLLFGIAYAVLGTLYLTGKTQFLIRRFTMLSAHATSRGASTMGLVLALNIPACAAPLLFAAAGSAAGAGNAALGFLTLGLFGLALSGPLFLMALTPGLANVVLWLGSNTRRVRIIVGVVLLLVGIWSIWFGLFVDPTDWQLPSQ